MKSEKAIHEYIRAIERRTNEANQPDVPDYEYLKRLQGQKEALLWVLRSDRVEVGPPPPKTKTFLDKLFEDFETYAKAHGYHPGDDYYDHGASDFKEYLEKRMQCETRMDDNSA